MSISRRKDSRPPRISGLVRLCIPSNTRSRRSIWAFPAAGPQILQLNLQAAQSFLTIYAGGFGYKRSWGGDCRYSLLLDSQAS